jgi:hypothetical protein
MGQGFDGAERSAQVIVEMHDAIIRVYGGVILRSNCEVDVETALSRLLLPLRRILAQVVPLHFGFVKELLAGGLRGRCGRFA